MNLALIVNQSKEDAESFQSIILQNLSERNIHPRIFLNKDFQREDFKDIDCIITLGGDGTILHTAGVLCGMEVPILGINAGHLGYLTEIRKRREIEGALTRLLHGEYVEDRRSMLRGRILREGESVFTTFRFIVTEWKWFTIPPTELLFLLPQALLRIISLREVLLFLRKHRFIL